MDIKTATAPATVTAAVVPAYGMGPAPAPGAVRLHLNEFRHEHHPAVLAAAKATAADLSEYAVGAPPTLLAALSDYVGVPSKHIVVAAGSDEILRAATLLAARRGIKVALVGVPTYTHLELFAAQAGLAVTPVQLGLNQPNSALAAYCLYAAPLVAGALVYIGSPNNPTGEIWSPNAIRIFAKAHPKSIFVVDEAYIEFENTFSCSTKCRETRPSVAHAMNQCVSACRDASFAPNIIVARTFSKAFGLAGMRIGYMVAGEALAVEIAAFISPKSVTRVAARCAEACLAHLDHYAATTAATNRVRAALETAAKTPETSQVYAVGGNFFLTAVKDPGSFIEAMRQSNIHVRDRSSLPGLAGLVRVTIGTPKDMAAYNAALVKQPAPRPALQLLYTPKEIIATIRRIYADTKELLNDAGVTWWATDGTLIGALRHGGVTPWDDDIDLGYVYDVSKKSGAVPPAADAAAPPAVSAETSDAKSGGGIAIDVKPPIGMIVDPVAPLVGAFAGRGYALQRNRTNAYWQVGTNKPGAVISAQHIDLFPYIQVVNAGKARFVNADPRFQKADPTHTTCNTSYAPDELFPLASAPWYAETIPVPAAGAAALDRAVVGWRRTAVVRRPGQAAAVYPMAGHTQPA